MKYEPAGLYFTESVIALMMWRVIWCWMVQIDLLWFMEIDVTGFRCISIAAMILL